MMISAMIGEWAKRRAVVARGRSEGRHALILPRRRSGRPRRAATRPAPASVVGLPMSSSTMKRMSTPARVLVALHGREQRGPAPGRDRVVGRPRRFQDGGGGGRRSASRKVRGEAGRELGGANTMPMRDRRPVAPLVALGVLDRVAEGVAVVEDLAQALLGEVLRHDARPSPRWRASIELAEVRRCAGSVGRVGVGLDRGRGSRGRR